MLDQPTRSAILLLAEQGHGARAIARVLGLSRGAVRDVLRRKSTEVPRLSRPEKGEPHRTEILELFVACKGNLARVHEELTAAGVTLSYQALTAFCRRHGLGHEPPKPSGHYDFLPGQEMQHDTSPHDAVIGGKLRRVQTASVVLCSSRMIFIQLYPGFTRFHCKVFLTDALRYFGGAAGTCMIDNTHVVVLHGTGHTMVPVPEMEAFSDRFGFVFRAHEKGHANRSAHVERGFDFVEKNFLAGREFTDFDHANREAIAWCDRNNAAFKRHLHATPRELFAAERPHLRPLPAWVPEVYLLHQRIVDIEGYVTVHGHRYSAPYQLLGRRLEVRETKERIELFEGPRLVATHKKSWEPIAGRVTLPEHRPPRGKGVSRFGPGPEERELLAAAPQLAAYVAELKKRGHGHGTLVLRRLLRMLRDYPRAAFVAATTTAAQYGLYDLDRLERLVLWNVARDFFPNSGGDPPHHEDPPDER